MSLGQTIHPRFWALFSTLHFRTFGVACECFFPHLQHAPDKRVPILTILLVCMHRVSPCSAKRSRHWTWNCPRHSFRLSRVFSHSADQTLFKTGAGLLLRTGGEPVAYLRKSRLFRCAEHSLQFYCATRAAVTAKAQDLWPHQPKVNLNSF